jgi:hypothetical protein
LGYRTSQTFVDRKANAQQKYLQKQGWTLLSLAVVRYQLQFRLDVSNLAFSCYLQFQFFNQHLFRAGRSMNPLPSQILVVRHPIEHPTHKQASMPLPTRPHAIFSTLQGTQKPDTKPTLQRLKMPTHSPPTPADLSKFVRHFSNISLLDTKAHPPPNLRKLNNLAYTITINWLQKNLT